MAGLRHGVNAGIGPPGAMHADRFAAERRDGFFERLLHGIAVGLILPADKIRAVIFDGQLVARHGSVSPA